MRRTPVKVTAEAVFDVLASHEGEHVSTAEVRDAVRAAHERAGVSFGDLGRRIRYSVAWLRRSGFNITASTANGGSYRLNPEPLHTSTWSRSHAARQYAFVVTMYASLDGVEHHHALDPTAPLLRSHLTGVAIVLGTHIGLTPGEVMVDLARRLGP